MVSLFTNVPLGLAIRDIGKRKHLINKNIEILYSEFIIGIRLVLYSSFLNSRTKYINDRLSIYRWVLFSLLSWWICFFKTLKSKLFLGCSSTPFLFWMLMILAAPLSFHFNFFSFHYIKHILY